MMEVLIVVGGVGGIGIFCGLMASLLMRIGSNELERIAHVEAIDDETVCSVDEFISIGRDRIKEDKLRWVEQLLTDEQRDWVEVIIKGLDMERFPLIVKEGVLFGGDEYIESQLLIMDENKRVQKEVLAAKEDPDKVKDIINESMLMTMGTLTSICANHAQSNALAQQMSARGMAAMGLGSGQNMGSGQFQQGQFQQGQAHDPSGLMGILGIRL